MKGAAAFLDWMVDSTGPLLCGLMPIVWCGIATEHGAPSLIPWPWLRLIVNILFSVTVARAAYLGAGLVKARGETL